MFACIYRRGVPSIGDAAATRTENPTALIDLAFTFSPLVEQTTTDTVVLDVSGQDLLFGARNELAREAGSAGNIANEIYRRGRSVKLKLNVAIAASPDAAIHAARAFKGVTLIQPGNELSQLGKLPVKQLEYSLVSIEAKRAEEIRETLTLWGIRTFGDLARLPLAGVAERMGQDGVRLQKLAQGKTNRNLNLVHAPLGFEQSLELEHPVTELEPLSFILSRLLNQLCANLQEYALATNELRLRLETVRTSLACNQTEPAECFRTLTLPVPMRNPKTLLRLLLFEIEREPPPAPIIKVSISAAPVQPRASQNGLFIPLAPEPEKLEITLARLAKLVGAENVGSPEILDTHRPDAFQMKRFSLPDSRKKRHSNPLIRNSQCVMGFRMFRPPWRADVRTQQGVPTRITAHSDGKSNRLRGEIICASGPWRASGDWWRSDVWARDEWDVAVVDPASRENEMLCRIYRDLTTEQWFVAGIYD